MNKKSVQTQSFLLKASEITNYFHEGLQKKVDFKESIIKDW